jgi:hypothetical protein
MRNQARRQQAPILLLPLLCLPLLACAAEKDEIVTDRPDFVESSNVV